MDKYIKTIKWIVCIAVPLLLIAAICIPSMVIGGIIPFALTYGRMEKMCRDNYADLSLLVDRLGSMDYEYISVREIDGSDIMSVKNPDGTYDDVDIEDASLKESIERLFENGFKAVYKHDSHMEFILWYSLDNSRGIAYSFDDGKPDVDGAADMRSVSGTDFYIYESCYELYAENEEPEATASADTDKDDFVISDEELYKKTDDRENILLNMKEGLADPVISEIYAEDISVAENIIINYYDCDLNDDGITDKIVTLSSDIHTDWRGDTLKFLEGRNDGSYYEIGSAVVPLYNGNEADAGIYILDDKTDNYHDVLVKTGDTDIYLKKYYNERYNPVSTMPLQETVRKIGTPIPVDSVEGMTQDEAIELCMEVLGKTDHSIGYDYGFYPNGAAELDGKQYYVITRMWNLGTHYSRIGEVMVASDGSVIYDGYIDADDNYIFADIIWEK